MADLRDFAPDVMDCLFHAESDPEAAAQALRLAAQYLRAGKTMPAALVEHLAGAIESAMAKPTDKRLIALGLELHLAVGNRRKKGDWIAIGQELDELCNGTPAMSQNAASKFIAAKYKRTHGSTISPSHVVKLWKKYLEAKVAHAQAVDGD